MIFFFNEPLRMFCPRCKLKAVFQFFIIPYTYYASKKIYFIVTLQRHVWSWTAKVITTHTCQSLILYTNTLLYLYWIMYTNKILSKTESYKNQPQWTSLHQVATKYTWCRHSLFLLSDFDNVGILCLDDSWDMEFKPLRMQLVPFVYWRLS